MMMIVISHFAIKGNWQEVESISPLKSLELLLPDTLGPIGAVIFFMITGFFYSRKPLDGKFHRVRMKIIKIWGETWFYSVAMLALSLVVGVKGIGIMVYAKSFLPVILSEYWFVTCYIILVTFSPYLEDLVAKLNKLDFERLLGIFLILMLVALINDSIINRLSLALASYFVGAYLSKFRDEVNQVPVKFVWTALVFSWGLSALSILASQIIGISFWHSAHFTQYFLPIVAGAAIMMLVMRMRPFTNRWINMYAGSSFAVYLMTESTAFVHYLWGDLLNVAQFQNSPWLYGYALFVTIVIFVVCATIDIGLKWGKQFVCK